MEQATEAQTPTVVTIRSVYKKDPRYMGIANLLPFTVYRSDGTWYDCGEVHANNMRATIAKQKHGV